MEEDLHAGLRAQAVEQDAQEGLGERDAAVGVRFHAAHRAEAVAQFREEALRKVERPAGGGVARPPRHEGHHEVADGRAAEGGLALGEKDGKPAARGGNRGGAAGEAAADDHKVKGEGGSHGLDGLVV